MDHADSADGPADALRYCPAMSREWADRIPVDFELLSGVAADLGCGRFPRNPLNAKKLVGIDILPTPLFQVTGNVEYRCAEVGGPLPIDTATVDVCTAYDFLEHLPRWDRNPAGEVRNLFIEMMNEVDRILVAGGLFIAVTPAYPSPGAFVDPTHVNTITTTTHEYFSGPAHAQTLGYGFGGHFNALATGWLPEDSPLWHVDASLTPVDAGSDGKPAPHVPMAKRVIRRLAREYSALRPTPPSHFLWVLQKY
jgi:SAM-dependent methyltransferase